MRQILLPSYDYPPAIGGVARCILAVQKTLPDQVSLLPVKESANLASIVWFLLWPSQAYDAIWTHHVLPIGTAAMVAGLITGKPYVVFLHGLDFDLARRNIWKRALLKCVLICANRVVTNSKALAGEVTGFIKLDPTPLVVYPALLDEFVEIADRPYETSRQPQATLRLLTVARLVERKGHLKVLEAMTRLPDVSYHIVGDGPMLTPLLTKIQELGLEQRVKVTTDATDAQLPDIYRAADIFVMPTTKTGQDREGFGIVYLEAQLFGLPVIATRQPGVDEAVQDGEGGLLIDDSLADLTAAIERLWDIKEREKLVTQGRVRVRSEFTREQQLHKLDELL